MDIDELISIEEYDSSWTALYEDEKDKLRSIFGELFIHIEHIGSTSVPGIKAKPIVDIMIGVDTLNLQQDIIETIKKLGYDFFGEISPGRIYCRKRDDKNYNLAIVVYESDLWCNNIIFRNYLRRHPEEAERYGKVKEQAILNGYNTLLQYSEKKVAIISELMMKSRVLNNVVNVNKQ